MNHATVKFGFRPDALVYALSSSVGVGGQHGELRTKAFHSFRHTVIEYLHKEGRVDLSMLQAGVGMRWWIWASLKITMDVIQKLNWISFFQRNCS
ncbi:hypothetical protein [Bilophila wadsworthia]|uniref:hypothetical protein n=1 Tax=Bilophila wadsworthia TaxID=35833 RepID=UPI001ED9CF0C|nr:hypothetical protein [Bilophila wadsworthia]MCG4632728.1 hypothetical protein [Bilophila wadsworthia]